MTPSPATSLPNGSGDSSTGASLDRDTTAQTKASRDRNAALARMAGAVENPAANSPDGRSPASVTEGQTPGDQTLSLTITGDINTNLERVLNGSDATAESLRSKIRAQIPFRFQLNGIEYDVSFTNGSCVVTPRATGNTRLATTLQGIFNNSMRNGAGRATAGRSETLENLRRNLK